MFKTLRDVRYENSHHHHHHHHHNNYNHNNHHHHPLAVRPSSTCLIISSMVFQVFFVYLLYNSALLLTSRCCSFLLHVKANMICVFLVSCQLVLLSNLPKFLHFVYSQKGCYSEKFNRGGYNSF
jgi:hypothetical protein